MIEITCKVDKQIVLRIQGHAETDGPERPNIICAAVSTLFCTLVNALDAYGIPAKIQMEPGDSSAACSNTPSARACMDFTMIGLSGVAQAHPESVKIVVE